VKVSMELAETGASVAKASAACGMVRASRKHGTPTRSSRWSPRRRGEGVAGFRENNDQAVASGGRLATKAWGTAWQSQRPQDRTLHRRKTGNTAIHPRLCAPRQGAGPSGGSGHPRPRAQPPVHAATRCRDHVGFASHSMLHGCDTVWDFFHETRKALRYQWLSLDAQEGPDHSCSYWRGSAVQGVDGASFGGRG
jgi:hypothetical protein